ncbi:nuclear transport factor 2 family protein [Flagellatimonas centrodinii]|uniref:nuclear transport factor 2 family protein n=1 Tax=Flagellatimonas centrodinii TaxID=2806210 RepID=UPI001FED9900|nr:nuclear transport factor 2 family protein [Flagellatimonas centrodinii]ULQ47950.1 nuclear transport factor 2 family protein [Flagellatimonas centrodinii]
MKVLNLPDPIAAYFDADKRDGHAVARCFTSDGRVTDEGQTHVGRAAIEGWKTAASAQFAYLTEPIALEKVGRHYRVTGRVTGTFPGSPVELRYQFMLERGRIASLVITP